jgi:hypothetical protein
MMLDHGELLAVFWTKTSFKAFYFVCEPKECLAESKVQREERLKVLVRVEFPGAPVFGCCKHQLKRWFGPASFVAEHGLKLAAQAHERHLPFDVRGGLRLWRRRMLRTFACLLHTAGGDQCVDDPVGDGGRCGSRERVGELGEDGEVGVKANLVQPAYAQGQQRPFVLEPAKLALNRPTALVERRGPLRVARDERVQPVGLDPCGLRLALAGRAAPLGRLPLVVGPGERPLASNDYTVAR